jgi:hypothetical protein
VFAIGVACTIAAQNIGVYPFRMVPLLIGIGLGCLGEARNNMVMRRRCIFAMGCVLTLFAYETTAWGLMCESALNRDAAEFCPNQLMIRAKLPRGRGPDRCRSGSRSGGKSVNQLNVLSQFTGGVPP